MDHISDSLLSQSHNNSEYLLKQVESDFNNLSICKPHLIESYVKPNYEIIEIMNKVKWFPKNKNLRNLIDITHVINMDIKHQDLTEINKKKKRK